MQTQQCVNCGYVTSEKYKLNNSSKDMHLEYQKLDDSMKVWSKVSNDRIWLPTIMTLPIGMIYPVSVNSNVPNRVEMKWAFSELIDIPKEEQEKYPDGEGGFYTKKYDTDSRKIYNTFLEGISVLNRKMKELNESAQGGIKIPKLKKKDGR
tara:strand:- start:45 stop:497 length:453 start_codon:yes stop_codon:yes gene_type:complete